MNNVISDSVSKLCAITDRAPIDWDAFDSVLKGVENINAYDDRFQETILSELIMGGNFYRRGAVLADILRHFLACGYDVTANDGLNGGLALEALCWSSYDPHILDAAKILMNAGAPVDYSPREDDSHKEPQGLLGHIRWKLSGAWMVDKDYAWANTLEAYHAMAEANIAGKDYNSIDNYFSCIGKSLTSVSAVHVDDKPALRDEGAISVYSEPLILWFGDVPLVVSCYTDFVANPVYADDNKDTLADVTAPFSPLIGATLQEVQYIDSTLCYFSFSNGKRLFFASRDIGDRNRVGTFHIRDGQEQVDVAQLRIENICALNRRTFSSTVTVYHEDAIALFCGDATYLLYLRPGTTDRYRFGICPCTRALLSKYTRQYPLQQPKKTTWISHENALCAARLDFPDGYLYMVATEYGDMEIQLSDTIYDPLQYPTLPDKEGKHMHFRTRKDVN